MSNMYAWCLETVKFLSVSCECPCLQWASATCNSSDLTGCTAIQHFLNIQRLSRKIEIILHSDGQICRTVYCRECKHQFTLCLLTLNILSCDIRRGVRNEIIRCATKAHVVYGAPAHLNWLSVAPVCTLFYIYIYIYNSVE